ncbi:MAG: DNA polymerase III subunit beta [Acidimicrobiia bacterium]|nr:DNA polymerase III subunit beta [Acidimicrobiia bacterium]MDH5237306.1 DNA polymerase III subunit beta [Acidimicrobiia bacterium]
MKFRCERDVLTEALGVVGRAVSTRGGALPVLTGIRAELEGDSLRLLGTDLELSIAMELTVAGSEDGVAVLPARLVADIVRSLEPGAVHLTVQDDTAAISAGRSEFNLRLIPADEFPRSAESASASATLPAKEFGQALRQVVPAASTDDSRPILTGVLLTAEGDGLRLVATDSYRLSMRDLHGSALLAQGQKVLLPGRALSELARLLDRADEVVVRLGTRDATFEVGTAQLTTRLIEGEFPNYKGLIPSAHPNRLTIQRETVLDAVRRVRLLARESTPVRLVMQPESVEIVAVTQDVGQAKESVDATFEGTELTVAFNPEYLLAGLDVTPGDEVVLETLDVRSPAVLKSNAQSDFLYLIMPVRVS